MSASALPRPPARTKDAAAETRTGERGQTGRGVPTLRRWISLVLLMLGLGGFALLARYRLASHSLLGNLELRLTDSRFLLRGPRDAATLEKIAKQVAVVAIDDSATRRYGRVIPRRVHAGLVRRLRAAGARAVVFDVLFIDPDRRDPAGDREFASAIRTAGNVFLPFDDNSVAPTSPAERAALERKLALPLALSPSAKRVRVQPPVPVLLEAMHGGGHVSINADSDAKFRSAPLLLEVGKVYPHVALDALAQTVWDVPRAQFVLRQRPSGTWLEVGAHRFGPLEKRRLLSATWDERARKSDLQAAGTSWSMPLDFLGGRGVMQSLTVPYEAALAGQADARLKGRVVLIGETATGTPDLRPGPFGEVFLGVYTNATLVANLLNDDFLQPSAWAWNVAITLLAGLSAGLLALGLRPIFSLPCFALLVFGLCSASVVLFATENLLVETTAPLVSLALNFVVLSLVRLVSVDQSARISEAALRETRELLGQMVSPKLAQELAASPAMRLELQIGARREVSVLFCDIRGFTSWSESRAPEEVKARLDEYFPTMCEICEDDYDGFIDKFIGDTMMVVWNAHKEHPNHAERAVSAALSMQRALRGLNDGWRRQNSSEFQIGVGVASGEAIWGTFGAPGRKLQPTVLGDTVNLAARLESLSKEYGPIVVSQTTQYLLSESFQTEYVGRVAIKGKSEAQPVYVVRGRTRSKETETSKAEV